MKLTINNNYQEDKSFLLYVKDEYIGELNTINSSAICDIEKEETVDIDVDIDIEISEDNNNHTTLKIVLFILALPFQAIFRMLYVGLSRYNWLDDAEPYTIHSETSFNMQSDTTINFSYCKSKYNGITNTFEKPYLISNNCEFDNHISENAFGLSNSFFNYIKNVSSCVFVINIILILIGIFAFKTSLIGSIICITLSFLFLALGVVLIRQNYKKYKEVRKRNKITKQAT